MKISYTVHSVAHDMVDAPVEYEGVTITAKVPMVTVELVSDEPAQANPVLRLRPESPEELARWARGAVVIGTFEPQAASEESSE